MKREPFAKIVADYIAENFDEDARFSWHALQHLCKKHKKKQSALGTALIVLERRGKIMRTERKVKNGETTRESAIYRIALPGEMIEQQRHKNAPYYTETDAWRRANECAKRLAAAFDWMTARRMGLG